MKSFAILSIVLPVLVAAIPNPPPPPAAADYGYKTNSSGAGSVTGMANMPGMGAPAPPAYSAPKGKSASAFDLWIPCGGSPGTAQCCATDVLGVADLDCAIPTRTPHSKREFEDICASKGQRARCCALPILRQALICSGPV